MLLIRFIDLLLFSSANSVLWCGRAEILLDLKYKNKLIEKKKKKKKELIKHIEWSDVLVQCE